MLVVKQVEIDIWKAASNTMFKMFKITPTAGFTLIELMVTVAILAISVSIATPSFTDMLDRHRLKGAVESVTTDLRYARSESIKRNQQIAVSIVTGSNWKYGIGDNLTCLTNVASCVLSGEAKIITNSFPSIAIDNTTTFGGNTYTIFQPQRGSAAQGAVILKSKNDTYTARVSLSALGYVSQCSDDAILGYPTCS